MDETKFSLRWHNHQRELVSVFESLLDNDTFSDVTLFTDGGRIPAHKIVLSGCSDYFKTVFEEFSGDHPTIIVKEITYEILRLLLEYMYKGCVILTADLFQKFMDAAKYLKVRGVNINDKEITSISEFKKTEEFQSEELDLSQSRANDRFPIPPATIFQKTRPPLVPNLIAPPRAHLNNVFNNQSPFHPSFENPFFSSALAMRTNPQFLSAHLGSPSRASAQSQNLPRQSPLKTHPMESPKRQCKDYPRRDSVTSAGSHRRSSSSPVDSTNSNTSLDLSKAVASNSPLSRLSNLSHPLSTLASVGQSLCSQNEINSVAAAVFASRLQQQKQEQQQQEHDQQQHQQHQQQLLLQQKQQNDQENLQLQQLKQEHKQQQQNEHQHQLLLQSQKQQHEKETQPQIRVSQYLLNEERSEQKFLANKQPSGTKITEVIEVHHSPAYQERAASPTAAPCSARDESSPHNSVQPAKPNSSGSSSSDHNNYTDDESSGEIKDNDSGARERLLSPGPSTSTPKVTEALEQNRTGFGALPWGYMGKQEDLIKAGSDNPVSTGFWKNSFKHSLLAPYLSTTLPPLSPGSHTSTLSPTFPGLYPQTSLSQSWVCNPNSPPSLHSIPFLRSNECSRCGRLYKTRKGLKHHIKNECGVEPRFQCTRCDWKFKQKAHLLRHMARKHTPPS